MNSYFRGECTEEEIMQLNKWMKADSKNEELFYERLESWEREHSRLNLNVEEDFRKLMKRIDAESPSKKFRTLTSISFLKIAAALALLVCAYYGYNILFKGSDTAQWVEYSNAFGEKSKHRLPDSSIVWLNSGSRLSYEADFESGTRSVNLDGEAFFEITPDKDKPFRIKTSDVWIEVLGTSFNVKSYSEEEFIETVVVSGKVAVASQATNNSMTLMPNERATYLRKDKTIQKSIVDARDFTQWKTGTLALRNSTINETVQLLERWYGVNIHLTGQENFTCGITGSFHNKTLEETLGYLKELSGLRYTIKDKTVTMQAGTCSHR